MLSRAKALGVAGVLAGVAALVPLYGDPRPSPVTHPEWARLLLRGLEMDEVLEMSTQASQVFAALSWKNSLAYRADRYMRGSGIEVLSDAGVTRVVAGAGVGEVAYPIAILRGGDYRVRLRIAGNPATPASAEITAFGSKLPARTFSITPAAIAGWVDAGTTHLDPGSYSAAVLLPPGTSLESIEIAPPCVAAVEPLGGWKPAATVLDTDLAVTMVKALDRESELPPAASAIEVFGSAFQTTGGATTTLASAQAFEGLWLRAGPTGTQALVIVDLPEAGLYTVSTFGIEGGGQSWLGDACRKAVLCGVKDQPREAGWRTVLTAEFTAGRHFFAVTLAPGAAVERLRLEPKKQTAADYLATIRRLGFDPGPAGPVTRGKAVDAMKFVQGKRADAKGGLCGDIVVPNTLVARLEPAGEAQGPGQPPPFTGTGAPVGSNPDVPLTEPQPPPTTPPPTLPPPPVTVPATTPATVPPATATPAPPVPTPSPTPLPTPDPSPPTLPTPPPASGIVPVPPPP